MKLSITLTSFVLCLIVLTGCQSVDPTTQNELNQLSAKVNDLQTTVSAMNEQIEGLNAASGGVSLQPGAATYTVETTDPTQPIVEITNIEPATSASEKNLKSTIASLSQEIPGSTSGSKYKGKKYIVAPGVSASDVQLALTNAGYNPGAIDGKIGKRTISAIKRFQRAEKLTADGIVGKRTWSRLSAHL